MTTILLGIAVAVPVVFFVLSVAFAAVEGDSSAQAFLSALGFIVWFTLFLLLLERLET